MAVPCVAAMTGYGQRSMAEMEDWKAAMKGRIWSARRDGSRSLNAAGRAETVRMADLSDTGSGYRGFRLTVDPSREVLGDSRGEDHGADSRLLRKLVEDVAHFCPESVTFRNLLNMGGNAVAILESDSRLVKGVHGSSRDKANLVRPDSMCADLMSLPRQLDQGDVGERRRDLDPSPGQTRQVVR